MKLESNAIRYDFHGHPYQVQLAGALSPAPIPRDASVSPSYPVREELPALAGGISLRAAERELMMRF